MQTRPIIPVVLALIGMQLCCRENTPPQPPPYVRSIQLEAMDASCTEAWLKLTLTGVALPQTVQLKRLPAGQAGDSLTVRTLRLTTSDSLVIDEGLLPNRHYTYRAYRLTDNRPTDSTTSVAITTMDTTTHNFTWQIDTLGVTSSVLYDVAIISDSNIWAVGELFLNRPDGQLDPILYNAAHWDGTRWEVKRIRVLYRGSWIIPQLNAIFAFSATDIWLSSGVPIHGDGQNWTQYHLFDMGVLTQNDGSINKIWGRSSSELWFVGNRGTIVRYASGTWRRVESGTTQYLQDVWGIVDQQTASRTVLCAASHPLGYGDKKILSINQSNTVDTVPWPSQRVVMSVWLSKRSTFYTCGGGVFRRSVDQRWKEIAGANVIPTLTEKVRGSAENDFFVVGNFGVVAHFNGVSFRLYPEAGAALVYKSLDFRGNQMISVGYTSSRAIVIRGIRN